MRKQFALRVVVIGALLSAVYAALIFTMSAETAVIAITVIVLLYIVVVYTLYVQKWRQVKALKLQMGWDTQAASTAVADTRFHTHRRAVSAVWFILYALIILATVVIGLVLYDSMPDQIVQKMDFEGNATKITDKSIGLLFFAPAVQAVIAILFAFIYWMMLRIPPVLDADDPETTSRQNAVFRYRWSAYVVFGGVLLLLIFLVMQLSFAQVVGAKAALWIPLIGTGILVLGAVVLAATTGQSGSRVRVAAVSDGKQIRRDDDKYWKSGMFYVNKDDPALLVEKRFGVGFTLNFGRPAAIAILVGILVIVLASVLISALLTT